MSRRETPWMSILASSDQASAVSSAGKLSELRGLDGRDSTQLPIESWEGVLAIGKTYILTLRTKNVNKTGEELR